MNLHAYLTFNGTCREAMQFYRECLGGELRIQTVGDSPLSESLPPQLAECILHATLSRDNLVLMGSDMVAEDGLKPGNTVSMMLQCDSEGEIRTCYEKLSLGGKCSFAIEKTFWGALFGGLIDRYGNSWLLHFRQIQK